MCAWDAWFKHMQYISLFQSFDMWRSSSASKFEIPEDPSQDPLIKSNLRINVAVSWKKLLNLLDEILFYFAHFATASVHWMREQQGTVQVTAKSLEISVHCPSSDSWAFSPAPETSAACSTNPESSTSPAAFSWKKDESQMYKYSFVWGSHQLQSRAVLLQLFSKNVTGIYKPITATFFICRIAGKWASMFHTHSHLLFALFLSYFGLKSTIRWQAFRSRAFAPGCLITFEVNLGFVEAMKKIRDGYLLIFQKRIFVVAVRLQQETDILLWWIKTQIHKKCLCRIEADTKFQFLKQFGKSYRRGGAGTRKTKSMFIQQKLALILIRLTRSIFVLHWSEILLWEKLILAVVPLLVLFRWVLQFSEIMCHFIMVEKKNEKVEWSFTEL